MVIVMRAIPRPGCGRVPALASRALSRVVPLSQLVSTMEHLRSTATDWVELPDTSQLFRHTDGSYTLLTTEDPVSLMTDPELSAGRGDSMVRG